MLVSNPPDFIRSAGSHNSLIGINFQKASCTLDGCVKVWTSRVDSVATETGKLLSGLADDMAGDQADSDAHEEGEGEEDGDEGAKKTRKRVSSTAAISNLVANA
jgi:condensin complex subunit 2